MTLFLRENIDSAASPVAVHSQGVNSALVHITYQTTGNVDVLAGGVSMDSNTVAGVEASSGLLVYGEATGQYQGYDSNFCRQAGRRLKQLCLGERAKSRRSLGAEAHYPLWMSRSRLSRGMNSRSK